MDENRKSGEGGGGARAGKYDIDRAAAVQGVIGKLLDYTISELGDEEMGAGEAKLLGKPCDGLEQEQSELKLDGELFNELDKENAVVRTLDNFSVYDKETGQPFNLVDLLRDRDSFSDKVVVYGTVVGPLQKDNVSLVRVARATPREGDHDLVIKMISPKVVRPPSNKDDASSQKGGKSSSSKKSKGKGKGTQNGMGLRDTDILRRAAAYFIESDGKEIETCEQVLQKLAGALVPKSLVVDSGLGEMVGRLRKHHNKDIAAMAKEIRKTWKSWPDDINEEDDEEPMAERLKKYLKKDRVLILGGCVKLANFIGYPDNEVPEMIEQYNAGKKLYKSVYEKIVEQLHKLEKVDSVTKAGLIETQAGKQIGRLCKHPYPEIAAISLQLKERWQAQIGDDDDEDDQEEGEEEEDNDDAAGNGVNNDKDGDGENDMEIDEEESNNTSSKNEQSNKKKRSRNEGNGKTTVKVATVPSEAAKQNAAEEEEEDEAAISPRPKRPKHDGSEHQQVGGGIPIGNELLVIDDSKFPILEGTTSEELFESLKNRPRARVCLDNVVAVTITHAAGDGTLWIETENARYRITGQNVPVAPSVTYYQHFVDMWKCFEACRRFALLVDNHSSKIGLGKGLRIMVAAGEQSCPRRFKSIVDDSTRQTQLQKDDIVQNFYYILDQLTRTHKSQKRINKNLGSTVVSELLNRGIVTASGNLREFIKDEMDEIEIAKREEQRIAKLQERKNKERKRYIDEGIHLPDDMEVMEEDRLHEEKVELITNKYVLSLHEKAKTSFRPSPIFLPCDLSLIDMDVLSNGRIPVECVIGNQRDFKTKEGGGTLGVRDLVEPGRLYERGVYFMSLMSLWSSLALLKDALEESSVDIDGPEIYNFGLFRSMFYQGKLDHYWVALVKFLSDEAALGHTDASNSTYNVTSTSSTLSKRSKGVFGVEDSAGISTRGGRTVGSSSKGVVKGKKGDDDETIPTYCYNCDELWPAPDSCMDSVAWMELARRAIIDQLDFEEKIFEEYRETFGSYMVRQREKDRKAIHQVLKLEPDLLSACDEVLSEIMDDHAAAPFCVPVDPVSDNAPDYDKVVSRPMDLGTVRSRLRKGHYDPENAPEGNRYNDTSLSADADNNNNNDNDDEEEEEANQHDGAQNPDGNSYQSQSQILKALDKRFYEHDSLGGGHQGVAADVRQVWRNARAFNKSRTKIYQDSRRLEKMFHKLYEERVWNRDISQLILEAPNQIKKEPTEEEKAKAAEEEAHFYRTDEEHIAPFPQDGIPKIEHVLATMESFGAFSMMPIGHQIRLLTSLFDMAMDTQVMLQVLNTRAQTLANEVKEFTNTLREDQKHGKTLKKKLEKAEHERLMEEHKVRHFQTLKENAIRFEPIGLDRFHNRYWLFEEDGALYVQMARTGTWGVYHDPDEIEMFIESLDIRGARENQMSKALKEIWPIAKREMEKARKKAMKKLDDYMRLKNGDPIVDEEQNLENAAAHNALVEAQTQYAATKEITKQWGQAEVDGKTYYYHRGTRETTWERPKVFDDLEQAKEEVERCSAMITDSSETNPETILETKRKQLSEQDAVLLHALLEFRGPEDKALSLKDFNAQFELGTEKMKRENFKGEVARNLALMLAIEAFAAGPGAHPNLSPKKEEWLNPPGGDEEQEEEEEEEEEKPSPRDEWLARVTKIVEQIRKCDETTTWAQVAPELKACLQTLYEVFVGDPYHVVNERAQTAIIRAVNHDYRFSRALKLSKTLSQVGMMICQLRTVLRLRNTAKFRNLLQTNLKLILSPATN